ncbi:MAG TPA: hypothetical protein VK524_25420 [Polyangiaceae bacterium]|nr:hypothetical protein [Polyangiaceae bacterium]
MCVCKQGVGRRGRGVFGRRQALGALGVILLGCGGGDSKSGGSGGEGQGPAASCSEISEEEAGDHPDKQTLIAQDTFYRSDISEGKPGVPLTLELVLSYADGACLPIAGANVEVWHADAGGVYSEYEAGRTAGPAVSTYLRGVQTSDNAGRVTFRSVYPGWYASRAAHVHVRVYRDMTLRKTTQIGFPDATSQAVYGASDRYEKGQNPTSNAADAVFGTSAGGSARQIAIVTGDNQRGYTASLTLAISNYSGD